MDPRLSAGGVSPSETQMSYGTSAGDSPHLNLPMQGSSPAQQTWLDRNSGELDLDLDLEAGRGPHPGVPLSNISRSSLTASQRSDDEEDEASQWNPKHPCYPHRNPHIPRDSPEYESTRIIRVVRDYMFSGDLSPAFSNVYPEILEPFVEEQMFREVVRRVNEELYAAHSPWATSNIVDGVVGFLTLWTFEDLVDTTAKRKIDAVEKYLESVNEKLEKETGAKFIPLRRTGYLSLDIQIPDPEVDASDVEDDDQAGDEHIKLHLEGMDRPPTLMVNGQFT
ncbi:Golgin subfamily A member 7/ERF4 family-domain-containing protein [Sphaerosporella brunnea]|uniref:Ras modification protein ERF4 n=1 Tax=Sphaerosporella brunnea TaxID=1250544 RepID=A0A5J5ESS2_9PEZI|nr:Golgin subfamily A member 7/ERF4 family-domain-containing protein [Sphaerosporella brunnea]